MPKRAANALNPRGLFTAASLRHIAAGALCRFKGFGSAVNQQAGWLRERMRERPRSKSKLHGVRRSSDDSGSGFRQGYWFIQRRLRLHVRNFGRGIAWLDSSDPTDLQEASQLVRVIQGCSGLRIVCPEELAYRFGFIHRCVFTCSKTKPRARANGFASERSKLALLLRGSGVRY